MHSSHEPQVPLTLFLTHGGAHSRQHRQHFVCKIFHPTSSYYITGLHKKSNDYCILTLNFITQSDKKSFKYDFNLLQLELNTFQDSVLTSTKLKMKKNQWLQGYYYLNHQLNCISPTNIAWPTYEGYPCATKNDWYRSTQREAHSTQFSACIRWVVGEVIPSNTYVVTYYFSRHHPPYYIFIYGSQGSSIPYRTTSRR
jgi:hypothetical protein